MKGNEESVTVYPPGYQGLVNDNRLSRIGRPGERLEKNHDCHELGSVMDQYEIDIETFSNVASFENAVKAWESLVRVSKAWEALCGSILGCKNGRDATKLIQKFIDEHGGDRKDVGITVSPTLRKGWEGMLAKGTGSPNKMMQTPRGPARAVAPSSASKLTEL